MFDLGEALDRATGRDERVDAAAGVRFGRVPQAIRCLGEQVRLQGRGTDESAVEVRQIAPDRVHLDAGPDSPVASASAIASSPRTRSRRRSHRSRRQDCTDWTASNAQTELPRTVRVGENPGPPSC